MSDAEANWANREEWAEECRHGFDIEINQRRPLHGDFGCEACRCANLGAVEIEVKAAGHPAGSWIILCDDHNDDDIAIRLYEERCRE